MFQLNKQDVCVGEKSVIAFSQSYCESDIIVPDAKPDMAKILQVSANVVISNKHCGADRITVDGKCDINILYVSEYGSVCAINTMQNFSDVIDAKGVTEGMEAEVEADLQNIDYNIINSRKLNLKMLVAIDANATAPVNCNLCTGIENAEAEILKKVIRPYNNIYKGYNQLNIKECLDLPAGKPDIDTIIKSEMRLCITEVKLLTDRVLIEGKGMLVVMYTDCNDTSVVNMAEYEIPFSEVLEVNGANEDTNANVKIKCEQLYTEPCCDSDGDNRRINMECIAGLIVKVFCETELEIIEDAYSTKCNMCSSFDKVTIDRLVSNCKTQVTMKDNVTLPSAVEKVCTVYAKPNISTTSVVENGVFIEGVMEVDILYMPADKSLPVCSFKHLHKFSQNIECGGANEKMLCDVFINVDHVSYNITTANEIEFRVVATIDAKIIEKNNVEYVCDLTEEEAETEKCSCCLIKIYYVQQGDSLWSIAKNYKTTVEKIMADNDLSAENEIAVGKRLIIS